MQVDCPTPAASSRNHHDGNVGFTVTKECLILECCIAECVYFYLSVSLKVFCHLHLLYRIKQLPAACMPGWLNNSQLWRKISLHQNMGFRGGKSARVNQKRIQIKTMEFLIRIHDLTHHKKSLASTQGSCWRDSLSVATLICISLNHSSRLSQPFGLSVLQKKRSISMLIQSLQRDPGP